MEDLEHILEKAKEVALEAGKIILDVQRSGNLGIEYKADGSPVTKADRLAEAKIRSILFKEFPDHGFEGEELSRKISKNGYTWSCDPIDGTWSYINHEKTSVVSLALMADDGVKVAVIYNPFTDELYSGAEGLETTLNDVVLPRHERKFLANAVLNFQISRKYPGDITKLYELWNEKKIGKLVSHIGSTAYSLAQVAEGCHGAYIARTSKPANTWDIAAGVYLVESVGGKVSTFNKKVMVAALNQTIHDDVLRLLHTSNFAIV